jgi:tRNA-specific 2-thiouridylase
VVSTDTTANTVTVTDDIDCPALWTDEFMLADVRWVAGEAPEGGRYLVRSRHTGELREATLEASDENARIIFDEAVRTVAPGQSVVVYRDNICFGGGILQR